MYSMTRTRQFKVGFILLVTILITAVVLPTDSFAQKRQTFDYSSKKLGFGGFIGLGVATSNVGAGFSFGGSSKIQAWQGIYLDPGFNWYIKSGAWMLSFAPAPQYMFRFKDFIMHPYAGFGPAFHIVHASGGGGEKVWIPGRGWVEPGDTSVKFGLHWTFGTEIVLNEKISLYNDYKFHLIFDSPDLFNITAGAIFYIK